MKKLLSIFILFFAYAGVSHAADVSLTAPLRIDMGKQFVVSVNVATENVSVNSFDVTVHYPRDLVSFKGYKEDASIKKLWLVKPTTQSDTVHFSGVVPGGVDGLYDPDKNSLQPIPLVQLLFEAHKEGTGMFAITHSDILENDGFGTPLIHDVKNASIVIGPAERVPDTKKYQDLNPPQAFTIQYIPAGFFSKTPPMIIFSTTDQESGVDTYQIRLHADSWQDVLSPLPIRKNLLKRDILVRALDFSGNTRESEITVPGFLSLAELVLILSAIFIVCFSVWKLKRKR